MQSPRNAFQSGSGLGKIISVMADSNQPKPQIRAIDIQLEDCGLRVAVAWLSQPGSWPELVVACAPAVAAGWLLRAGAILKLLHCSEMVATFEVAGNSVENVGRIC